MDNLTEVLPEELTENQLKALEEIKQRVDPLRQQILNAPIPEISKSPAEMEAARTLAYGRLTPEQKKELFLNTLDEVERKDLPPRVRAQMNALDDYEGDKDKASNWEAFRWGARNMWDTSITSTIGRAIRTTADWAGSDADWMDWYKQNVSADKFRAALANPNAANFLDTQDNGWATAGQVLGAFADPAAFLIPVAPAAAFAKGGAALYGSAAALGAGVGAVDGVARSFYEQGEVDLNTAMAYAGAGALFGVAFSYGPRALQNLASTRRARAQAQMDLQPEDLMRVKMEQENEFIGPYPREDYEAAQIGPPRPVIPDASAYGPTRETLESAEFLNEPFGPAGGGVGSVASARAEGEATSEVLEGGSTQSVWANNMANQVHSLARSFRNAMDSHDFEEAARIANSALKGVPATSKRKEAIIQELFLWSRSNSGANRVFSGKNLGDLLDSLTRAEARSLVKNFGTPGQIKIKDTEGWDYGLGPWARDAQGVYEMFTSNSGMQYSISKGSKKGKWEVYRGSGTGNRGKRIGQFKKLSEAKKAAHADVENGFDIRVMRNVKDERRYLVVDVEGDGSIVGRFKTRAQAQAAKARAGKSKVKGSVGRGQEAGFINQQLNLALAGGATGAVANMESFDDWEGAVKGAAGGLVLGGVGGALWGSRNRGTSAFANESLIDENAKKVMNDLMSPEEYADAVMNIEHAHNRGVFSEAVKGTHAYMSGTLNFYRDRMGRSGKEFADRMWHAYDRADIYTGTHLREWTDYSRRMADDLGVKWNGPEMEAIKKEALDTLRNIPVPAGTTRSAASQKLARSYRSMFDKALKEAVDFGIIDTKQALALRAKAAKEGYAPRIYDTAFLQSPEGQRLWNERITGLTNMSEADARKLVKSIIEEDSHVEKVMAKVSIGKDGKVKFTDAAASEMLRWRNYTSADPRNRFLEKSRRFKVADDVLEPFLVNDADSIAAQYFQSLGNRFGFAEQFGKNGEIMESLRHKLDFSEGMPWGDTAREIYYRATNDIASLDVKAKFGIDNRGAGPTAKNIADKIDAYETLKLGFAPILNLTQALGYSAVLHTANSGFLVGMKNFTSDIHKIMGQVSSGEWSRISADTGAALETTMRAYATENALGAATLFGRRFKGEEPVGKFLAGVGNFVNDPNDFLKLTGFLASEKFNRSFSANIGYLQAKRLAAQADGYAHAGKPMPKDLTYQLEDLGMSVKNVGKWTEDDFLHGGLRWSNLTNFRNRQGDLPMHWQSSNQLIRMFRKFKTFAHHAGSFLWRRVFHPMVTGKVRPDDEVGSWAVRSKGAQAGLTYAGVAAPLLGVPASYVREFMKEGEFEDLDLLERWVKGAASIGGLGLWWDIFTSHSPADAIAGPAFGDVTTIFKETDVTSWPPVDVPDAAKGIINWPTYVEEAIFGADVQKTKPNLYGGSRETRRLY